VDSQTSATQPGGGIRLLPSPWPSRHHHPSARLQSGLHHFIKSTANQFGLYYRECLVGVFRCSCIAKARSAEDVKEGDEFGCGHSFDFVLFGEFHLICFGDFPTQTQTRTPFKNKIKIIFSARKSLNRSGLEITPWPRQVMKSRQRGHRLPKRTAATGFVFPQPCRR